MALEGYPNEICGLILGAGNSIDSFVPVRNVSEYPTSLFKMDKNEFAKKMIVKKHDLLGFYHSHPNGVVSPSAGDYYDSDLNGWNEYLQMIIAVLSDKIVKVKLYNYKLPLSESEVILTLKLPTVKIFMH